jgi:hypothetical protein
MQKLSLICEAPDGALSTLAGYVCSFGEALVVVEEFSRKLGEEYKITQFPQSGTIVSRCGGDEWNFYVSTIPEERHRGPLEGGEGKWVGEDFNVPTARLAMLVAEWSFLLHGMTKIYREYPPGTPSGDIVQNLLKSSQFAEDYTHCLIFDEKDRVVLETSGEIVTRAVGGDSESDAVHRAVLEVLKMHAVETIEL